MRRLFTEFKTPRFRKMQRSYGVALVHISGAWMREWFVALYEDESLAFIYKFNIEEECKKTVRGLEEQKENQKKRNRERAEKAALHKQVYKKNQPKHTIVSTKSTTGTFDVGGFGWDAWTFVNYQEHRLGKETSHSLAGRKVTIEHSKGDASCLRYRLDDHKDLHDVIRETRPYGAMWYAIPRAPMGQFMYVPVNAAAIAAFPTQGTLFLTPFL